MKRLFCILASFLLSVHQTVFAIGIGDIWFGRSPEGSILTSGDKTPIVILTIIQSFLLKIVLPIVIVGASLYIAYGLFTAEGDETKLKKAWKSIGYTSVALIAIALSYAFVSIISSISL